MPRALVTGGAGFLGGHLADALAEAGFGVRLLDVADPGATPHEFVRGDVRDAEVVDRAAAGCEVVVDNAALVPVTLSYPDRHDWAARIHPQIGVPVAGERGEKIRAMTQQVADAFRKATAAATQLAQRMVREFGMSAKLGPVGFGGGGPMYLGQQEVRSRDYAEATQALIDEEVSRLLKEADARAFRILTEHRDVLDKVRALLIERESIDGADVYRLAGRKMPERAEDAVAPASAAASRAD